MNWEKGVVKKEVSSSVKFRQQGELISRFGNAGLLVYLKIDNAKTALQIMRDTNTTEKKFIEIMKFMEEEGMIEKFFDDGEDLEKIPSAPSSAEPSVPPKSSKSLADTFQALDSMEKKREKEKAETQYVDLSDLEEMDPVERKIYEKYSKKGVQVYRTIDGEKTMGEIMAEIDVSEKLLMEILEFLNKEGIIQLETEGETPKEKAGAADEEIRGPAQIHPLRKIIKKHWGIIEENSLRMQVMGKYGTKGNAVFSQVSKLREADEVDVAKRSGIPIDMVGKVFDLLIDKVAVINEQEKEEEIKKKYGFEGYLIHRKFGRESVLLYELIDKNKKMKDIFDLVALPPEETIDIFLYIHKLLNIDIPISREILIKQLKEEMLTS